MSDPKLNVNEAPFPHELVDLVRNLGYKDNFTVSLELVDRGQGSEGLTLCILMRGPNTYKPAEVRGVMHYMPVPPAAYNRRAWQRWLLEQLILVERHEACEWFKIGDERPYAPNHGPGCDPYTIVEYSTDEERRTLFTGVVKD